MKGLIFCFTFSLFLCYFSVNGSGYFKSPLNRGSYYRYLGAASYADKITVNRDDAELNCGGQHTLGRDLTGLCGACGDPANGVKAHEAGGVYAIGYPSAIYNESSIINVTVTIVNKKRGGFFEFYLCESDSTTAVTESCFQQHPLKFAGTAETRTRIGDVEGDVTFELQLPAGVVCQYCVMRMTWVTASELKCFVDAGGTKICGVGASSQPTYVNCADVKIVYPNQYQELEDKPDYPSLYASLDGDSSTTISIPIFTAGTTPSGGGGSTTEQPPTTPGRLIGPIIPLIPGLGGGVIAPGVGLVNGIVTGIGSAITGTGTAGTGIGTGTGTGIGNVLATSAITGGATAGSSGLFGGAFNPLLPLIALGVLIGLGSMSGGGQGDTNQIIIQETPTWGSAPPINRIHGPNLARYGRPFMIPSQQTQISVSASIDSGGYPGRYRGYGQSRGYSKYNG